jgi:hypothetical protein
MKTARVATHLPPNIPKAAKPQATGKSMESGWIDLKHARGPMSERRTN